MRRLAPSAFVSLAACLAALASAGPVRATAPAATRLADPGSAAAGPAIAAGDPAPQDSVTELTADLLSAFGYRFIGPANPSGRITALAVPEGTGGRTAYAGMASGGVWKTSNAGTTWESLFDDQGTQSIGDVAVAPYDPDEVWVGTGERNSLRSNSWGDGVYVSRDGGASWTHLGLEETREIGRIAVHPTDTGTAFVAALGHLWGPNPERGVYRTTDGGESWEKVLFVDDTTGFVDLKMHPGDPDVLFAAGWHRLRWGGGHMEGAGAGSGIYRSTDGGDTWTELTEPALGNGLPTEKLGRIGLAVHPERQEIVYAVIQVARGAKRPDVSPFGGLFRSTDGGDTWTRVNDLSAVPDYYYNEVWLNPRDPDEVFLAATRIARSTDGGRTFSTWDLGNQVHVDHHALWIDPGDPDHVILGNDGGVYVSRDHGETWAHQIVPAAQFYEVDVDSTRVPYHVCGGLQDNGTWCGPSRTRERAGITEADWYKVFGGDGFHSAVSPDDPTRRYVEFQFGNVMRLDAARWEYTPVQPLAEDAGAESGFAFRWDWNTPINVSHHDPTTVYLGGNHLFRLRDGGEDWEILGPDMTRQNRFHPEPDTGHTAYHSLHSVAESALDVRILWAGSNDGLLWVSTDAGESWENVTPRLPDGGPPSPCWVSEIEPSRHEARAAFVTYDCHRRDDYRPYVYRTVDAGATWQEITGDLPEDAGSFVVRQSPANPDLLFVGTHRGVWVSIRGGGHWARLGSGLPNAEIRDLNLAPRSQFRELVVGSFGRGVYVLPIHALEQLTPEVLAEDVHFFEPPGARQYNLRDTYGATGDRFFATGAVEPGVALTYYLRTDRDDEVSLVIRKGDGSGEEGRAVGTGAAAGGEAGASGAESGEEDEALRRLTGPASAGIHRVAWDLRRDEPRPRELDGPTSTDELRRVLPGTFTVTLEVGGAELTREVVVREGWHGPEDGRIR